MKYEKIALLINSKGGELFVKPKGTTFTLEELRMFVNGDNKIIKTKDDNKVMVVSKLKGLPVNKKASGYTDVDVFGDVLLVDKYLVR
jgi:hypothetical protein